jgi:hypothetical protein
MTSRHAEHRLPYISVDDRLPGMDELVLVITESGYPHIASFDEFGDCYSDEGQPLDAALWATIPYSGVESR